MADQVTSSRSLLIETLFLDGDTRTLTLKNPKNNITLNDITTLNSYLASSNVLIGDREGAPFFKIKQVVRRNSVVVKINM